MQTKDNKEDHKETRDKEEKAEEAIEEAIAGEIGATQEETTNNTTAMSADIATQTNKSKPYKVKLMIYITKMIGFTITQKM